MTDTQRERLLHDPTAADELMRWGLRHNDPFAQSVALAYIGADSTRWQRILHLSHQLSPTELTFLSLALSSWPALTCLPDPKWTPPKPVPWAPLIRAFYPSSGTIKIKQLRKLIKTPQLHNIKHLDLRYQNLGDAAVELIASAPTFQNLTHLDLRFNSLTDTSLLALAQSPHIKHLQTLYLQRNQLTEVGLKTLVESPFVQNLTFLDLRYNEIGDPGDQILAHAPYLQRLSTLFFDSHDPDSVLAQSPYLASHIRAYWRTR